MAIDVPEGCSWPSDVYERPRVLGDDTWPFEGWWLLMAGRGQQATSEQVQAILDAQTHLDGYKGGPGISAAAATFARAAVRDALFTAPQPLTQDWLRSSLSIVAGLAQWCVITGQPLERTHVLHAQVYQRYLVDACGGLSSLTQSTYQARLAVIASAVLAPPTTLRPSLVGLGLPMLDPVTEDEEAVLWGWAIALRPDSRRDRLSRVLALGLGTGARRKDMLKVAGEDVTRDADGVHVHFHGPDTDRTVTCRREWEDRLWDLVKDVEPGFALAAPHLTAPLHDKAFDSVIDKARLKYRPAVHFSTITLRSGWMVRHLAAGTALNVLMPAAQVEHARTMVQLLAHVPTPTAAARIAALRGA